MRAALELLGHQFREPALDEVQPRARGRGEMQDKARVAGQPALDRWCLVGEGVVEDEVDVEVVRDLVVDLDEELTRETIARPRPSSAPEPDEAIQRSRFGSPLPP